MRTKPEKEKKEYMFCGGDKNGEGQDVSKNFRWLAFAEFSPGEEGIEIISCCFVMFWAADKHY